MEEKDRLLQRILSLTTSAPWTENLRLNRESIRTLCEEGMLGRIRRMYLTGGGTSLYAAEVGRSYMERIAGIPAQAVPCYSFSHYIPENLLGPDVCLLAISQTGTARSVENCVRTAQRAGALDIVVSGSIDARVPAAARRLILTDAKTEGPSAKSTSYIQAITAVYLLAIAIGLANGHLTARQAAWWDTQLEKTVQKSAQLGGITEQMYQLAAQYKNAPIHHCLAAGPNVGTVEEGALKIIEMAWVPAEGREMEDFLHGRYREVDETTPLLLVAPLGPSKEKLMDTLGSAKRIYAPTIVLTDDPDPAIARLAAHVVKMPGGVDEFLTPLLYITPLWLYAHRMGLLRGGDPAGNRHGFIPTGYDYRAHYDETGMPLEQPVPYARFGSDGRARDLCDRQIKLSRRQGAAAQPLIQKICRYLADCFRRHGVRCQGRAGKLGELDVAQADYRHLLRYADTDGIQRAERGHRHQVAGCADCGGGVWLRHQLFNQINAENFVPLAVQHPLRANGQTGDVHGRSKSEVAAAHRPLRPEDAAAQKGDFLMAFFDKMVGKVHARVKMIVADNINPHASGNARTQAAVKRGGKLFHQNDSGGRRFQNRAESFRLLHFIISL